MYRPGGQFGPKNQAVHDAKLTTLAATIIAANRDVLAVREVGEPAALDDLAAGGTPPCRPTPTGIRVESLTRTAPAATEQS